jgi:hypothetical protein
VIGSPRHSVDRVRPSDDAARRHSRAYRARRDHRIVAFAAIVMVLFTLAATALASAGSPHHARPAAAGIIAPHTETNVAHAASGHDHKQGNVWAPTVGKCLRPAAAATECTL